MSDLFRPVKRVREQPSFEGSFTSQSSVKGLYRRERGREGGAEGLWIFGQQSAWQKRCSVTMAKSLRYRRETGNLGARALGRFLILRAHKFQTAALCFHPPPSPSSLPSPSNPPFWLPPALNSAKILSVPAFRPTLSPSRGPRENSVEFHRAAGTRRIPTVYRIPHPARKRILNSESASILIRSATMRLTPA